MTETARCLVAEAPCWLLVRELLRVGGIAPDSLTIGRGCLDTVPRAQGRTRMAST